MAIRIKENTVVQLAYRLTDTEGNLIEERTPEEPFSYIQGRGQIVAPVERSVQGKTAGFRAEVFVSPREAYGDYQPSLVAELSRDDFPKGHEISIGMKFSTLGPDGRPVAVRVISVEEEGITIDGNHPLAGIELIFELRVLDVREATESEFESGLISEPETSGPLH